MRGEVEANRTEYSKKNPDSQTKNQYHISEVEIDRSLRGLDPCPQTLVVGPLVQSAPSLAK